MGLYNEDNNEIYSITQQYYMLKNCKNVAAVIDRHKENNIKGDQWSPLQLHSSFHKFICIIQILLSSYKIIELFKK